MSAYEHPLSYRYIRQHPGREAQTMLPRRWGRILTSVTGVLLGALLGLFYARALSLENARLTLAIGAVGGAALGYLAIAIPRFAFHFLLREWYRTIANHWRALLRQRAEAARRDLSAPHAQLDEDALADLGVAYYLRGDSEQAAATLTEAHSQGGHTLPLLNALAAVEADLGRWEQAANALANALRHEPHFQDSLDNLATLISAMPAEAELPEVLHEMLQTAGARALNNMAVRQMRLARKDPAKEYLQMALAAQPLYPHAEANIGVMAFNEGDTQTAAINLAAAAQLAPGNADILSNLGAALAARDNQAAAERVLRQATRIDARQAAAIINYGCLRIRQQRHDDAVDLFNSVPTGHPLQSIAWHNAAVASEADGEYGMAYEYEQKAEAAQPENPDVLTSLGTIEWRLANFEQADEYFQRALQTAPDSVPVVVNAARSATAVGRLDEAITMLEGLQDGTHYDIELVFDLGVTQLMVSLSRRKRDMNRTEQALFDAALRASITAFEQNLTEKGGKVGESRFNIGLAYYLRGEPETAAEHFEYAVKLLQDDENALHFCAGTALAEAAENMQKDRSSQTEELIPEVRQLLRRASAHLQKAAEADGATADTLCNLGMVLYKLGQNDEALKTFRRFAQMENSVASNNTMGLAYARRGQRIEREARMKRATNNGSSQESVNARKLFTTAIHYFGKAVQMEPNNTVLHRNLGLAYMLRNQGDDMESALRHWGLMRAAGDEYAERQFASMMQVMQTDRDAKAEFHDIGRALRQIDVFNNIRKLPPVMGRPLFVTEPVMDTDNWQLQATHPDLQVALRARQKLSAIEARLRRLAV
jgi:tetratricopeptide (TPR) repeat protein